MIANVNSPSILKEANAQPFTAAAFAHHPFNDGKLLYLTWKLQEKSWKT